MKIQTKLALLIVTASVGLVFAAGRQSPFVTKIARNDGDSRAGFSVSVTTTAWTTVLSSDVRRRYAVIHGTGTAMLEICLSTVSASATTCSATTDGRHMPNIGIVIEDYNEAPLYARSVASSAIIAATPVSLYGEYQYDSTDSSDFQ